MMKKRIGNDIIFTWHIYRKDGDTQVPESFDGKEVEVKLISPLRQPVTIEDVTIATGVVTFTFRGKHQVTLGNYVAILQENRGEDGMVTLDVVNAVTLVPHSYMEEDGDDGDVIEAEAVELESEIGQGIDAYTKAESDEKFVHYGPNANKGISFLGKDDDSVLDYSYIHPNGVRVSASNTDSTSHVRFVDITADNIEMTSTRRDDPDEPVTRHTTVVWHDELDEALAGKQDLIQDLAAIRSGAHAGSSAYQKPSTGIPATDLASAVQVSLSKADTALQEHQSLAGLVNTGSYNTVSKKIELKHDNTVLAEIDATAFIKDGMVSSVTINNGYLIITFNTDAGKEPISIALTDIFNPANYYTKTQVDNALSDKLDNFGNNYGVYNGVLKISGLQDQDGDEYIRNGMHLPQGLEIYYYDYKTTITGEDIVVHSKGEPEDGRVSLKALAREVDGKANTSDLAEVATSGSYNDLSDKPDLSAFITKSVDNLVNYYLKSETYTKTEVQQLIGAIQQFHYEVYPTLPQTGASNVLYLIGPTGSGTDKYEEYVYANNDWTKIGDTSIDLSGYVTTEALTTALADYVTSSALSTTLANYYNKTEVDGLFAGKENVMPITTATGATLSAVVGNYYRLDNVGTLAITLPTIVGATKLQAITFLLACGSSALVTFAPQDSETILYQEDFALEADTTYEVTALWNGSEWTLSRVIYE